jgi:uncharacterized integral membrane protein
MYATPIPLLVVLSVFALFGFTNVVSSAVILVRIVRHRRAIRRTARAWSRQEAANRRQVHV